MWPPQSTDTIPLPFFWWITSVKVSACMTATLYSINFNFFYESDIILIDVAFFQLFNYIYDIQFSKIISKIIRWSLGSDFCIFKYHTTSVTIFILTSIQHSINFCASLLNWLKLSILTLCHLYVASINRHNSLTFLLMDYFSESIRLYDCYTIFY